MYSLSVAYNMQQIEKSLGNLSVGTNMVFNPALLPDPVAVLFLHFLNRRDL
jgi:hypothetical protein